jgi:hypothetical protein
VNYDRLASLSVSGSFTLPAELIKVADVRAMLRATLREHRARTAAPYNPAQTGNRLYSLANGGAIPADLNAFVFEAMQAESLHAHVLGALDNAVSRADDQLNSALKTNGARIIEAHLRPRFYELIEQAAKLPRNTATLDAEALKANPKGQADYRALCELAAAYAAVLEAHAMLTAGTRDVHGLFRDVHADPADNFARGIMEPIGPAKPVARLRYLAHEPSARPWLPTKAEQDARLDAWQFSPIAG